MIRRSFFPAIVFLCSTMLNAQVIIKEKVEIRPKAEFPVSISSSSSSLPYFEGSIVPDSKNQAFRVTRPCRIVGTGTLVSTPLIPVIIILGNYPNEAQITNRTDSIRGDCGAWVPLYFWNYTSCGSIYNVRTTGTISDNQIQLTISGDWSCQAANVVPFTANVTLQAVPIGNSDPRNIAMSANPTVLSSSGIEGNDLSSSLSATVFDGDGNPVQYCGTASMVFAIENPIEGVTLRGTGSDGLPREGTSIEVNFAQSSSSATFVWDGKTLSEDSVIVRVRAEGFGLSATQDITLKLKKPVIKLSVQNAELRPLGDADNKGPKTARVIDFSKVKPTTVTVTAKYFDGKPVADYPFTLSAYVRHNSGGHDHTANRPTGRFITKSKDTVTTFSDKTGSDGTAAYTYLCSGFGGVDSLRVKGKTDKDTSTKTILLRIPNLQELTEGEHYDLVGMYNPPSVTSEHRTNHFGAARLVQKLKALADSLHKDSSYVMRVNDMSLKYGGPFDTENTWDTPHQLHREGVNADISYTATGGRRIPDKIFEKYVEKLKGKYDPHGHYHTTFR